MEIENIELNRDSNKLAFILHKHSNNNTIIETIINKYSLDTLIKTKNNGIISNLLLYFITKSNDSLIDKIVGEITYHDIKLMKRDYLNLIKYYYNINHDRANDYFEKIINQNLVILSKDIEFLIENKLYIFLKKLNGLFIQTSIKELPLVKGCKANLELIKIDDNSINITLNKIENLIPMEIKLNLEYFTHKLNNIDVIVDGGNVIHSRHGSIGDHSLYDLKNLLNIIKKTIGNPLLIIHKKHIKNLPQLNNILTEINMSYYLTPYCMNDDIFILWFFLKMMSKPFIVSNDKYRDHIYQFEITDKINNIVQQQTLNYNIINMTLSKPLKYSNCIQIKNNKIYIPHTTGQFIELQV